MTPNEIACALALIASHMKMTHADIAAEIFGVRPETLGNWRRGAFAPPRSAQAVLRLLQQSIQNNNTEMKAAVMAALGVTYE